MRNYSAADALFPEVRKGILATVLLQPERWWYASDLARHLGTRPSSLQRELAGLTKAGILRRRRDGNRVYYQADPACPFLGELAGLMAKTAGLVGVLRGHLAAFAERIDFAFVYGSVARGDAGAASDVDLMIVGRARLSALAGALRRAERELGREINATVYSSAEFAGKARSGHHFVRAVLNSEKLYVVGGADDLERIAGRAKGRRAAGKQTGAG